MKYTEEQFNNLVEQFNSRTLPKTQWTHMAHILVAFWYVSRYSETETLDRVRNAIKDYNTAVGTMNTDSSGYHETLTVFWLKMVRAFLSSGTFSSQVDAVNAFIEAGKADKNLPLEFYSKEKLFSVDARRKWVEADKKQT